MQQEHTYSYGWVKVSLGEYSHKSGTVIVKFGRNPVWPGPFLIDDGQLSKDRHDDHDRLVTKGSLLATCLYYCLLGDDTVPLCLQKTEQNSLSCLRLLNSLTANSVLDLAQLVCRRCIIYSNPAYTCT